MALAKGARAGGAHIARRYEGRTHPGRARPGRRCAHGQGRGARREGRHQRRDVVARARGARPACRFRCTRPSISISLPRRSPDCRRICRCSSSATNRPTTRKMQASCSSAASRRTRNPGGRGNPGGFLFRQPARGFRSLRTDPRAGGAPRAGSGERRHSALLQRT